MKADLHIHSHYSDGQYSPADIVGLAKERGLDLISVTDHDNVLAADETALLCAREGLEFTRGVEISAYSGDIKVHTLGYGFSPTPAFGKFMKKLYDGSFERCDDVLSKLKKCGVNLSMDDVLAERKSRLAPVHAIYIARAAQKAGFAQSPYTFYGEYMTAGKAAYSTVARPTPEEAIACIHEAGGIASLAHPGRITLDRMGLIALIRRLKCADLDAIEVVYSTHTAADTQYFSSIAKEYGLFLTGGSDSHYKEGRKIIGVPDFYPDKSLLEKLL